MCYESLRQCGVTGQEDRFGSVVDISAATLQPQFLHLTPLGRLLRRWSDRLLGNHRAHERGHGPCWRPQNIVIIAPWTSALSTHSVVGVGDPTGSSGSRGLYLWEIRPGQIVESEVRSGYPQCNIPARLVAMSSNVGSFAKLGHIFHLYPKLIRDCKENRGGKW